MSGIPARLRRMVHGRIRRFGGGLRITLRERSTLKLSTTGAVAATLDLVGDHAAGAAALTLGKTGLIGALPEGAKLTLAATEYTVTARVEAVDGELVAVAIDPVLAAPATDGDDVTVTQPYGDFAYSAMQSRVSYRDAMKGMPDDAKVYDLSAVGQARAPRHGDILLHGSQKETVTAVEKPSPSGEAVFWRIFCGSAA